MEVLETERVECFVGGRRRIESKIVDHGEAGLTTGHLC